MLAWVLNALLTKVYIAIELLDSFIQSFVFFRDMVQVNNTELDFSLILCNAICLFFVHSYVASKIERNEKMEEKVTMRLKKSISNY